MSKGWIGVDLDGTLAMHYPNWKPPEIGAPIPRMVERVKKWLAEGKDVRILTARVAPSPRGDRSEQYQVVTNWCIEQFGRALPITCEKDYAMIELWDDRAVQVVRNTGMSVLEWIEENNQTDQERNG